MMDNQLRKRELDADRRKLARRNSITTFVSQIINVICGIIIPRMMIGAFGSVLYGATTSISQFLSYISLMESGIGRSARSALYQPLADSDRAGVGRVYYAIRYFFRAIAIIFVLYTIVLAYFFYDIANAETVTREYLFFLVIAIALSTVVDYLCGITNQTLLNADQRKYVTNAAISITRILNTLLILILIQLGSGLILVKLGSSLVIILRPLFLSWYVKRHYSLPKVPRQEAVLPQKWSGMAQHIAYFIHTNTDILLLTVFANLRLVAVYAVYSLIVTSIRNLIYSAVGGMEAELGNIYARGEQLTLRLRYRRYQFTTGMFSAVLFGVTAFLIVPFVQLYTKGITDAEYIQPAFALILVLGEAVNCLALPCSTMPISGSQLKQSQWGSFGEAIVNIGVSCLLLAWNPLLGVAIGTLAAEVYKLVYYSVYVSRHILRDSLVRTAGRHSCVLALVTVFGVAAITLSMQTVISGFAVWMLYAVAMTAAALVGSLLIGLLCYREDTMAILKKMRKLLTRAG